MKIVKHWGGGHRNAQIGYDVLVNRLNEWLRDNPEAELIDLKVSTSDTGESIFAILNVPADFQE